MSKVPDSKTDSKAGSDTGKNDAKASENSEEAKKNEKPSQASAAKSPSKKSEMPAGKTADKTADKPAAKPDAAKAGGKTGSGAGAGKAAPRSGGGFLRGFVIAAVLVVAAVVAGALTARDWWPAVEPYVGEWVEPFLPQPEVDENAARLAAIERRIEAVETAADEAASADALADLQAARAELSQQIDDIMARLDVAERALSSLRSTAEAMTSGNGEAASALAGRLDELDVLSRDLAASRAESQAALDALAREVEALADVRAGASAASVQAQTLVLTTGQVRRAVIAGGSFEEPLAALEASSGDDPDIRPIVDVLRPHAATGVATLETLRQDFAAIAATVVQAGHALDETDWVSSAINKVSSLVSVRRTDGAGDPASVDAMVARAENRLAAGDLAGAVEALDGLPEAARNAAAGWLETAGSRLEVDGALDDLHTLALDRLRSAASAGQG